MFVKLKQIGCWEQENDNYYVLLNITDISYITKNSSYGEYSLGNNKYGGIPVRHIHLKSSKDIITIKEEDMVIVSHAIDGFILNQNA